MMTRFGIIEEPELRVGIQESAPMIHVAFDREYRTGRHIVHSLFRKRIDESGNTGIMRKKSDGMIVVSQAGHHLFERLGGSMILVRDDFDILFLTAESMREGFGCLQGAFCRAGKEPVDSNAGFDQTPGHDRRIAFTPVIQRSFDILFVGIVPAAFSVAYYQ